MSGVLTNQQKSGEYYRIAYKCAETKQTTGCNGNCATCVLNVHLYVDDPREATLIKTSAAMDYGKYVTCKSEVAFGNMMWQLGRIFGFLIIAAFIFFGYRSCAKKEIHIQDVPPEQQRLPVHLMTDEQLDAFTYEAALYVQRNIKDVNKDGEVNCIDRALLYKDFVPEARIFWNKNDAKKFNHVFIGLDYKPGEIEKLEPACTDRDWYNQYVFVYWGDRYDERLDKDITAYEKQIRNNTMRWVWELY